MTNDPAPADSMSPALAAALARFDRAYAEYLAAKADVAAEHENDTEETDRARYERERTAELALLGTPAPTSTALWSKFALLEEALLHEAEAGQFRYPITIFAVGALKADLVALGVKDWLDV